jgi:hypothetical protein
MLNRANILSELKAISPVVEKLPFSPVFTVPEGYFTQFPETLLQRIRKEENQEVFTELEEISPLLAAKLTKKMPFSLPEGYFSESILPPNSEAPVARVVPMYPAKKTWMLYAAAAIVALVGVFSLFYLVSNNDGTSGTDLNLSAELPKLKSTELNTYLLNSPDDVPAEPLSLAGLDEIDFESLIDEVNDKELSEFLSENPSLRIEALN